MRTPLDPYQPALDFSVVISCYFEEKSIDEFHQRLSSTLETMGRSYEIIFVNDGSDDRTWEKLETIFEKDPKVSAIVDLYKNAGQANAKTPGIMIGRGKAFVLMDSDLQLDPEELPSLVAKYDEDYDIVSGYRKERRDPLSRKLPSKIANMIMRKASNSAIRDFGCTYKIYDGRLVRGFAFGPFKPWRSVPVIAKAKRIAEVAVTHRPRKHGKSGWTFQKLFAYNMENLVNISTRPFQILGAACLALAVLFFLRIATAWLLPVSILRIVTPGLLLNVSIFSLLVIVAILCIIGEFVIRIFVKSHQEPAFIVRSLRTR
jgi:glycosyltransferase involved in cell wall biosynthesis